jgi:retinol dehydrogenase-12
MQCPLLCCWPVDLNLTGKLAIVTGSNRGIGFQTALALAQKGMHVILAVRDVSSGKIATRMINSISCVGKSECIHMDLCNFDSIRQFVKTFESLNRSVDILVNNAAIMACPYAITGDGFESQFQTNHLGHFLLTMLLLPKMSKKARIVNVSSVAHMGSSDLNLSQSMKFDSSTYDAWGAYCDSKFANILFTYELQKRLKHTSITATTCHPGIIISNLWKYQILLLPASSCSTCSFKLPNEGSKSVIYAATTKLDKNKQGYYVSWCCCFVPLVATKIESYNSKRQKDLWDYSEKAVNLTTTPLQEVDDDFEEPSFFLQVLGMFCM